MSNEESKREVIADLDNEWHTLRLGNPVPSLYPQTGAETVRIRGKSKIIGEKTTTDYEIIVLDNGNIVGTYTVHAEEALPFNAEDEGE